MGGAETITVLVPVLDGAPWLASCLGSLAAQERRPDEVIVVDGCSGDGSAALAAALLGELGLEGRVLTNPGRSAASNLSTGLAAATGTVVCRLDVRAVAPPGYLAAVERALARPGVVLAGGAVRSVPAGEGVQARAVARAHGNQVLMGLAAYRSGGAGRPTDTVYLGGARTVDLRAVGGWDTHLDSNEDYDLARRLAERGEVWLIGDLCFDWQAPPDVATAWRRLHRYGRGKVRFWRHTGRAPSPRQWMALTGPPLVAVGLAALAWRRPVAAVAAAGAVTAAVVATDATVATVGRPAPARERIAGVGIGVLGAAAWWSGVVRELVAGRAAAPSRSEGLADHRARVCHAPADGARGPVGTGVPWAG